MDPFDEFEFKPLTDGLGFHKKTVSLKEGLQKSGVLNDELQAVPAAVPKSLLEEEPAAAVTSTRKRGFEDVLSALEKSPFQRSAKEMDLSITETLPREKSKKQAMDVEVPEPVRSPFPRPEAFKSPQPQPASPQPAAEVKKIPAPSDLANTGTRRGAADSPQRQLVSATISIPSAFLDLILITALGLLFVVALLMVTKVNLNLVWRNLQVDPMVQISLAALYVAVMEMYVLITRSYFGRTLGEWTFDLQLGEDADQKKSTYPLRIVFRSLLTLLTGLVFLPLVSALVGRDIAGALSGVKLYRQRV